MIDEKTLEYARTCVAEPGRGADAVNLATALLSIHARIESMAAVVAAAEEWRAAEVRAGCFNPHDDRPDAVAARQAEWRTLRDLRAALDGYGGAK